MENNEHPMIPEENGSGAGNGNGDNSGSGAGNGGAPVLLDPPLSVWGAIGRAAFYFGLYIVVQFFAVMVVELVMIFPWVFQNITTLPTDPALLETAMMDFLTENMAAMNLWGTLLTDVILLPLFILIPFIRRRNPMHELSVRRVPLHSVPLCLLAGISVYLVVSFIMGALEEIPALKPTFDAYNEQASLLDNDSPLTIALTVIGAPIIEELLFRALLISRLRRGMPVWVAALVASFIFGLMHGQVIWVIYATLLGILLSAVYIKTDSVIPGVILHFAFNISNYVFWFDVTETEFILMTVAAVAVGAVSIWLLLTKCKPEPKIQ